MPASISFNLIALMRREALVMAICCTNSTVAHVPFSQPYRAARRAAQRAANLGGSVTSSNALANRMLRRVADIDKSLPPTGPLRPANVVQSVEDAVAMIMIY